MRNQSFKALQQQAYDYLKSSIINHTFEYDHIYSESKISLEIGISRTPVRDAVHRLYQEGLIDIIPNKGFILHRFTHQEMMENQEIRSAIEGYCARKAAIHFQSENTKKLTQALQESLDKQREIFHAGGDVDQFVVADQEFHYLLVAHNNNEAFLETYSQCMYRIKKIATYSLHVEGRMEYTLQEHQDILHAIQNGHPQEAYDAIIQHMEAPLIVSMDESGLEKIYE